MWLQSKRSPNPTDRRLAHAGLIRQRACTAMSGAFRNRFQGELHDSFYGVSPSLRGAPGRGSSSKALTPPAMKRLRQNPTVNPVVFRLRATAALSVPAAHRRMILARKATERRERD